MQPIDRDGVWSVGQSVCRSVCLSVTVVSPAKTVEPIKMPFGLWTQVCPRNRVLDGGRDPSCEGAIFEGERGAPL